MIINSTNHQNITRHWNELPEGGTLTIEGYHQNVGWHSPLGKAFRAWVGRQSKCSLIESEPGRMVFQKRKPEKWSEIYGYCDFQDLYEKAVAEAPEGATFVEIGVWLGRSLALLADASLRRKKRISIRGVDSFQVSSPAAVSENLSQFQDTVNITLYESVSWEGATAFEDGSAYFVFIDASHDYDSVRKDIEAWRPKVQPGGILAGHDRRRPGVAKALKELLPRHEHIGSSWRVRV